jgi:glycerophosphoryl diester phosphodiesterase
VPVPVPVPVSARAAARRPPTRCDDEQMRTPDQQAGRRPAPSADDAATKPLAVAHRGEPVGNRENTLPAIVAAIRAGADMVETDVKVTADGEVVLLHDDTLDRLWGRPWRIRETRADTLTQLADDHRHTVPTLREALALISATGVSLLIDLDGPDWAGPSVQVVHAAIDAGWVAADEVVWCGRPDALTQVRTADPNARIVLSWDERTAGGDLPTDQVLANLQPEAFNPHWPMLTDDAFGWARDRGLRVSCWTVDDEQTMRRLCSAGVDAMISNRIHALRKVIDEHRR